MVFADVLSTHNVCIYITYSSYADIAWQNYGAKHSTCEEKVLRLHKTFFHDGDSAEELLFVEADDTFKYAVSRIIKKLSGNTAFMHRNLSRE